MDKLIFDVNKLTQVSTEWEYYCINNYNYFNERNFKQQLFENNEENEPYLCSCGCNLSPMECEINNYRYDCRHGYY
jgi:hypothetical protein